MYVELCQRGSTEVSTLTAEDEVGVEDAESGLVGALLIVDSGWDDEAEGDARHALQHDQNDGEQ